MKVRIKDRVTGKVVIDENDDLSLEGETINLKLVVGLLAAGNLLGGIIRLNSYRIIRKSDAGKFWKTAAALLLVPSGMKSLSKSVDFTKFMQRCDFEYVSEEEEEESTETEEQKED